MAPFPSAPSPSLAEQFQAALLAALCGLLFLGQAVLPSRSLVPYPPEAQEPLRSEALAAGTVDAADLLRGNASMGDKYNQSLAWDRITRQALRDGRVPRWTRDIGGGAAFVPQMGQVYQPWNLLLLAVPSAGVYGMWFLLHQIVFGLFAYRFVRRLGVRHTAGLLAVVAAVLGLWTQARLHHNVILTAALPAFLLLECVQRLFAGEGARTAGVLGLGLGLSWLGGMPQVSLLLTYVVLAWAGLLWLSTPRGARRRPVLWLGVAMGLGGGIGLAQMVPVLVAASLSSRATATTELLASRSLGLAHALTLVWPDLLAWPGETFYGRIDVVRPPWATLLLLDLRGVRSSLYSWPETAVAAGIPALVAALHSVWHPRRRIAWFFVGVAVFGFGMAMALGPMPWLTVVLPGSRSGDLRRFLFLVALALPILAALGLDALMTRGHAHRAVLISLTIALASGVLLAVHARSAADVTDDYVPRLAARFQADPDAPRVSTAVAEQQVRAALAEGEAIANRDHLVTTFARALAIALLSAAAFAALRRRFAPWLLLALAAAELLHAGAGAVISVPRSRVTTPPAVLAPALAATRAAGDRQQPRPRFQRLVRPETAIAAVPLRPNLGAFYGLEDLAAYNPLPPRRMEELFEALDPGLALGGAGVGPLRHRATLAHPMWDVLGLRWLLTDEAVEAEGLVDRTRAGEASPFRLYERTTTLPRATFVTRVRVVPDRTVRLRLLADPGRDAAQETILEDPSAPVVTAPAKATVDVVSQTDERVVVHVDADAAGYLRLADPWHPGWRATVDGEEVPIRIADHDLRAVYLPAGRHEAVFTYDGPLVVWPPRLALLAMLVALALIAGRRRR